MKETHPMIQYKKYTNQFDGQFANSNFISC